MKFSSRALVIISIAIAAVLFVALLFVARGILPGTIAPDTSAGMPSELIGAQAPAVDLPDTAGDRVSLDSFSGTPVVLVFWATWNSSAADQIDSLDSFLGGNAPERSLVKIIAVDSEEDPSVVSSFMRRGGYRVETLVDVSGAVSQTYAIKSLPTTYFIDRNGVIRDGFAGVLSSQMLVDKIDQLLQ